MFKKIHQQFYTLFNMENHDFYLFKKNVKENTSDEEQKKGGISIESLNFDRIKF